MFMLTLIVEMIGAVIGGVIAAALICRLFWTAFKLLRHPEWGPLAAFVVGIALLHERIAASPFFQAAALFCGLFAVGCWWEGRDWRARRTARMDSRPSPPATLAP